MFGRVVIPVLLMLVLLVTAGPGRWLHLQIDHAPTAGHHHHPVHLDDGDAHAHQPADAPHSPIKEQDCHQCHLLAHSQAVMMWNLPVPCLTFAPLGGRLSLASLHEPASAPLSDLGGRDPPAFIL